MSGLNATLLVCIGANEIARLELVDQDIVWVYTSFWKNNGYSLSPYLPLEGNISPSDVKRYLNNLLPEGRGLDELTTLFSVSKGNVFALVKILGQDLTSIFNLSVDGCQIARESTFVTLDESDLSRRLSVEHIEPTLTIWKGKPRLSVAGVQNKINVVVREKNELGFGEGSLRSTHLLKFETTKSINLVVNEYITMHLAMACGLNVANVELRYFDHHPALLVERFDRKLVEGVTLRKQIIDGCQALNLPPEYKYERNFGKGRDVKNIRDGASLVKLFGFANQCANPALTKKKLLDWVLFNLLVFNADAHGKNISFFVSHKGMELSPFYDLVNISLFDEFDRDLAMAIGDEFDINSINAYQLACFADDCLLGRRLVSKAINALAKKVILNIDRVISNGVNCTNVEREYFDRYKGMVENRANHFLTESHFIMTVEV